MWATCAARPTTSGCGTFWLFSPPSPCRELRLPDKTRLCELHAIVICYRYVFPRIVCEQLLRHLDMSNVLFWGEALSTVRAIVGGVDYMQGESLPATPCKGCMPLASSLPGLPGPDEATVTPPVNTLFFDFDAPDSCCAECHYPHLVSTTSTVREQTN